MTPQASIDDVLALLRLCDAHGIALWLDGGWAVDALLGEQTRAHGDIDIVVQERDTATLRRALEERGYHDVERDDTSAWNFVLGDEAGREVDFHVITLDAAGNGVYGPAERGERFPAASLQGEGVVGGRAVRCIAPEWLVKFHTGYTFDEDDAQDVRLLCERFGIPLPPEYR